MTTKLMTTDAGNYFRTQPRSYQLSTHEKIKDLENHAILYEMRLGKSKQAIDNACYLYHSGKIDALVVIVRKSIIDTWNEDEIPKHVWNRAVVETYKWNKLNTKKEKQLLNNIHQAKKVLKIYTINIEAFSTTSKTGREKVEQVLDGIDPERAMVVIDEATDIKTPDSNRTKWITKAFERYRYKRILTGTPLAERPEDAYALYRFLDKNFWDFGSYWAFKNYFCVYKELRMGNRTFKKIVGYKNLDKLRSKILNPQVSTRYTMRDVVSELPEKVYKTLYVELTKTQRKHYNNMTKMLYTATKDDQVEVMHAAHKYMKLHQIACGTIHMETTSHVIEDHNPRIQAVFDLIDEQYPKKAVIFSMLQSTETVNWVYDKLCNRYGPETVVKYTGETPQDERQGIIHSFQDPDSPVKIFVGNQAAKMGIKLYPCDLMIYYSNDYSYATREQAEKRCDDVEAKTSVCIVDIIAENTEDKRIVTALKNKKDIIDTVMEGKTYATK